MMYMREGGNERIEEIRRSCRQRINEGQTEEEIATFLHECRLSLMGSIRLVFDLFGVKLGEAKEIVAGHPCWRDEAKAQEPLHDAAIRVAEELAREQNQ